MFSGTLLYILGHFHRGTFLYMAPELLMGDPPSVQSDLYALGVMFYELACGQPPFKGEDPLALISQHLHATPTPPSTHNPAVPVRMETLILRLLAKQPADRPASAMEVREFLEGTALDAEATVAPHTPLDRVVCGRLVGRERELAEAIRMFRKAQQGENGILLISGEAGVGKSRLVRELTVQVKMANGLPLIGDCYAEGGVPYAALAQMLLSTTAWPDGLSALVLADLISLAPGLRVRYPDIPLNPPLDPRVEQQRVYESAFIFFASLAQRFPLLLVIEDVHWADGGTLALVRSLARRFQKAHTPAMIVLTYRDVELTDQKGITDLLSTWNRERMATPLKLHRLDRQGTCVMLEALFAETVAVDFVDTIYHETEGNPFFIEELCKALIEGGQIYRENGSWKRRSTQSIEIPRSIRMAIEARFNSLPAASVEVLYLASILGRRFEFDVLQAAAPGENEDTLITALEDAEEAQLLYEIGHGRGGVFEFAHAMIPTTLVEGLSGMRRRRLHRRVITALEKLHPEDYKTLAHHCLQASEDERALEYLIKAARSARATFANTEAVANYQQAAGVLNDLLHEKAPADSLRSIAVQLYEDLGDVLQLIAGQHEEARKNYQNAMSLTAPDDLIRFSRVYRRMGKTRETLLLYKEAEEAYGKAEIALGTEPAGATPELLAQWRQEWLTIQLDRFYLCYWQGNIQEMERLAVSIRPMIEQYGTSLQYAKFNYNLAMMLLRKHHYIVADKLR